MKQPVPPEHTKDLSTLDLLALLKAKTNKDMTKTDTYLVLLNYPEMIETIDTDSLNKLDSWQIATLIKAHEMLIPYLPLTNLSRYSVKECGLNNIKQFNEVITKM